MNKDTNIPVDFKGFGIGIDDIISEVEQLIIQGNKATENKGLLTVKTANLWIEQAKTRPIPQMLFGEFWFEGELCILFVDKPEFPTTRRRFKPTTVSDCFKDT